MTKNSSCGIKGNGVVNQANNLDITGNIETILQKNKSELKNI